METKICSKCGESASVESFAKRADCIGGRASVCKPCRLVAQRAYRLSNSNTCTRKYEKSPKGFLMRTYRNMQSRIEGVQALKAHLYKGKYLLSREEFYQWAESHPVFKQLFTEYKDSGFDRRLAPSPDRVDSTIGYALGNMEWVTHSENSRRGSLSRFKRKAP